MKGAGIAVGKPAGSITSYGYRVVKVGHKSIRAGRLAWFLTYGVWPDGEIDHINGIRLDDRLSNLRVADRAMNSQNKRACQKNNKSCGLLGVTWNRRQKKWQSKIMANKKSHHVGVFDCAETAHLAYLEMKRRLHVGCTI